MVRLERFVVLSVFVPSNNGGENLALSTIVFCFAKHTSYVKTNKGV